jgi:type 2 lantibiotic biosynthesis protein LanM
MAVLNNPGMDAVLDRGGKISSERLLAQALVITEQIAKRAIRAPDGSATWIAPHYLMQAARYQLQPMGYDLYNGTCGLGLFLAAVEKITGGADYRELALGTVQPLRQAVRDYGQRTVRDMGIGGAAGLGSVIYALTRMSQWLDEPLLLADATQAAKLITAEHIAHDKALDTLSGASGAILGLLTLLDASHDEAMLDRAITCGQHLLKARTESKLGLRAWSTFDGKMLTGFSHGAAGIAYALLRLYAVTGDGALLAAAQEGIAYEDSVFVPEASNWPDFRTEEQLAFMASWCHGAPGIGLARIAGLQVLDTTNIRKDIDAAMQITQAFGVQGVDHLCCGTLGRADILLTAASRLSRPDLAVVANTWAWQIVIRAEETDGFALHPLLPKSVYSPGFFQGTAGIGYALLRIAHPGALPCVLLWE